MPPSYKIIARIAPPIRLLHHHSWLTKMYCCMPQTNCTRDGSGNPTDAALQGFEKGNNLNIYYNMKRGQFSRGEELQRTARSSAQKYTSEKQERL
jgi:hypothetical protein